MKYFLLLASFLFYSTSNSQDFVVTIKGDTITGEVIIELPGDHYDEVYVKTENDKFRLKAYQVLFIEKDSIVYKPVKYAEKYHLMKEISGGYLSHFQYRNGTYDFGTNFLLKSDGEGIDVPNLGFKKSMSEFVSECEVLSNKIKNKELSRNDLSEIVSDFNSCIDKNTLKSKLSIIQVVDVDHPGIKKLYNFKAQLPEENSELITLVNDIINKLASGNPVPGYLISAFQNQTKEMTELNDEVEEIIKSIK